MGRPWAAGESRQPSQMMPSGVVATEKPKATMEVMLGQAGRQRGGKFRSQAVGHGAGGDGDPGSRRTS